MKRKICIVIYIALICFTIKLLFNIVTNKVLIDKYNNGEYMEKQAKALTYVNFIESYISHYNYGNIFYQNGEYQKAIEEYRKSLSGIVPKYKECNIRINYALAMCKTVELDEKDSESIKKAINIYESAINILTEDGCANKQDNNGHSQKAEQLKKDILKEIERLKNLKEYDNSSEKNDDKEQENKKDNTNTIEEKIQDIKENATKEQRKIENQYKNYKKEIERVEKNW